MKLNPIKLIAKVKNNYDQAIRNDVMRTLSEQEMLKPNVS